ncbi:MAG TPA: hypothetical protein VMT16_11735 [Thermoanaerobaculia bacterium]|nr:hypothetical protein [Thermoanaerobaculia bacterium]
MIKKAGILLLLSTLGIQASAAARLADLKAAISSQSWNAGLEKCEALARGEGRRPDVRQLPASHYARLATHCAALASGAGDQWLASWWWFTATAMDVETALPLLDEFRRSGLLTNLQPPRTPMRTAEQAMEPREPNQVRLLNGDMVEGLAPVPQKTKMPTWLLRPIGRVARAKIVIEVVVGADGSLRQPLVLSAQAPPLYGFQALHHLRQIPVQPAIVDGEPVDSLYTISFSMNSSR